MRTSTGLCISMSPSLVVASFQILLKDTKELILHGRFLGIHEFAFYLGDMRQLLSAVLDKRLVEVSRTAVLTYYAISISCTGRVAGWSILRRTVGNI